MLVSCVNKKFKFSQNTTNPGFECFAKTFNFHLFFARMLAKLFRIREHESNLFIKIQFKQKKMFSLDELHRNQSFFFFISEIL